MTDPEPTVPVEPTLAEGREVVSDRAEIQTWTHEQLVIEVLRLVRDADFLGNTGAALIAEVARLTAENEKLGQELGTQGDIEAELIDSLAKLVTANAALRARLEGGIEGWMWNDPTVAGYRFVTLKHLAPVDAPVVSVLHKEEKRA